MRSGFRVSRCLFWIKQRGRKVAVLQFSQIFRRILNRKIGKLRATPMCVYGYGKMAGCSFFPKGVQFLVDHILYLLDLA